MEWKAGFHPLFDSFNPVPPTHVTTHAPIKTLTNIPSHVTQHRSLHAHTVGTPVLDSLRESSFIGVFHWSSNFVSPFGKSHFQNCFYSIDWKPWELAESQCPRSFAMALFINILPLLQMRNCEILFKLRALIPTQPVFQKQKPLTHSQSSFDS